jgi:hypothetical protein
MKIELRVKFKQVRGKWVAWKEFGVKMAISYLVIVGIVQTVLDLLNMLIKILRWFGV